jgi:hypothetical protein
MKKKALFIAAMLLNTLAMISQTNSGNSKLKDSVPLPQIKQNGVVKQMFVDGKPYIMLAGELHNSSASSTGYMKPIWDKLKAMNLNTVVSTVSWELVEPEEGKFNFDLVDAQITEAGKRDLRLVIIWFASWKNSGSSYTPLWVKTNPARFPVQKVNPPAPGKEGMFAFIFGSYPLPLSPMGEASMLAEAKAFKALMRHIKEVDPKHTVIMMQVDNEMGLLGDSRDRSSLADEAWAKPVPGELINYLSGNKAILLPEMQEVWGRNGYKTSGTWAEVFGKDEWAEEVFMAWYYSVYINKVILEGKAELNLPMYVNAWLGPQPGAELPGTWPSGGPVARVMDVWRAGAPSVDLLAPDIYVDNFKGVLAEYTRSGNPLWIPEAKDQTGNLFWALGHHSALGFAVFGIEDLNEKSQLAKAYSLLGEMLPLLSEWQAAGKVKGILLAEGETKQEITLGGYNITVTKPYSMGGASSDAADNKELLAGGVSSDTRSMPDDVRPFGLIINTAPDEFLIIGSYLSLKFSIDSPDGKKVAAGSIDEGIYVKGVWKPGRRINGDEVYFSMPKGKLLMQKIKVFQYK